MTRQFPLLATPAGSWADHLATPRELLDGYALCGTGTPESSAATHAYLDIVATALG